MPSSDSSNGVGPAGVNGEGRRPRYRALTDALRKEIAEGQYAGGQRLPTELELCERYGMSRQTVRHAYRELVAEGLVHRVPGKGTFTGPGSAQEGYSRDFQTIDDLMQMSADMAMQIVQPLRRRVNIDAAGRLGLDSDLVHEVVFRRVHDGTPISVVVASFPSDVAEILVTTDEMREGAQSATTIVGLLDGLLPSRVVEAQQSITVALVDEHLAGLLECPEGHAVLRIDRTYFDGEGKAVELSISYLLPEMYSYRTRLTRSPR